MEGKGIHMARRIEVVDYDPQWAKLFKAESKKIRTVLGKKLYGGLSYRKYIRKRTESKTGYVTEKMHI